MFLSVLVAIGLHCYIQVSSKTYTIKKPLSYVFLGVMQRNSDFVFATHGEKKSNQISNVYFRRWNR